LFVEGETELFGSLPLNGITLAGSYCRFGSQTVSRRGLARSRKQFDHAR
jgi:hypothetical protein